MKPKKWVQKVVPELKKGALRAELGVKAGSTIPKQKLLKATHSDDPLLKKRSILAENFSKMRKKK